jgi:allantoate deiminase
MMNDPGYRAKAAVVMRRIGELAAMTDEPGMVTRWFLSPAMKRVNARAGEWMAAAGMSVKEDGWGNLLGRMESPYGEKVFLIASHLDTVRNAGKYDGILGVLLGIAAVELIQDAKISLPFHLDVAGFSDEEGLRFQATYLGSRAVLGKITAQDLQRLDREGIRLGALVSPPDELPRPFYRPGGLAGYLEAHIEQGPVLENLNQPAGVVSAIAGQSRAWLAFTGCAGHAGTSPMELRRDALAGAADFILAVEQCGLETPGLVATVGYALVEPGASNVIPGCVALSVDVRHAEDGVRETAVRSLEAEASAIASARGLSCLWEMVQSHAAAACDTDLVECCTVALRETGVDHPAILVSGAGHDAAVFASETPTAMFFIRSPGGISHHPDESVREEDVAVVLEAVVRVLKKRGKVE